MLVKIWWGLLCSLLLCIWLVFQGRKIKLSLKISINLPLLHPLEFGSEYITLVKTQPLAMYISQKARYVTSLWANKTSGMVIWIILLALPTGQHVSWYAKTTQEGGVRFKPLSCNMGVPQTPVTHCWKPLSQLITENFIARKFVTCSLQ